MMTTASKNELAIAWINLQKAERNSEEYNSLFWSFQQLDDLAWERPLEAWQIVLTIWSLDQSNKIQENLSAGPIEDLLVRHGDTIIPLVEERAQRDQSFARLLGGVWKNSMSDEVWHRLQAVWDRRGWDGVPEE